MSTEQYQQQYDQGGYDQQQGGYGFQAEPKTIQQRGKYREPNEYEDEGIYDSEDGGQYNMMPENYWEYIEDQDEEDETQLEPDYYIDRPPTPEFKPLEKGKDIGTQIEDYELFDFEIEVVPVLQVLVGKTIDQARMELIEDSEVIELKKHKAAYVKKRNAELLVTQRMENAFLRRKEERERRDQQHTLRKNQNIITHKKMICRDLVKKALSKVKVQSLDDLEDIGFLKTNITQNIQKNFLPWLLSQTASIYNQSVKGSANIQAAFKTFEIDSKNGHQKHIQAEIERKKEVLRQRELRRLELEERKRKKKEWKRKKALKEAREVIKENVEKNIALQSQKLEHILDGDFTDILGDSKEKPIVAIFGGLVGQLWIIFGALQKLTSEQEQQFELNDEEMLEFVLNLLNQKLKNNVVLHLNEVYLDFFNEKQQLMADNLAEFNEIKEEFIEKILEDASIYTNFPTLNQIKESNQVPLAILKPFLKALLTIYFKSVDFKDPVPVDQNEQQIQQNEDQSGAPKEGGGEEQPQQQQEKTEEQSQQQSQIKHEEPTPQELNMVEAKKKIELKFDSQKGFEDLESLLRIRVPFLSPDEIELERQQQLEEERKNQEENGENQENQENQENNQEQQQQEQNQEENKATEEEQQQEEEEQLSEAELERRKYAIYDEFVETYNGDGYQQQLKHNLETSRRKDVSQEQGVQFQIFGFKTGLIDERSEDFLRGQFLQILKEQFPEKLEVVGPESFNETCKQISEHVHNNFEKVIPRAEEVAIFDYDLYL